MNPLLVMVLSNLAVAALLACVAWSAGRWLRRPALTHALWLLVLLKLLTPPLVPVTLWRTMAEARPNEPVAAPAAVSAAQLPAKAPPALSAPAWPGAPSGVSRRAPAPEAPPVVAQENGAVNDNPQEPFAPTPTEPALALPVAGPDVNAAFGAGELAGLQIVELPAEGVQPPTAANDSRSRKRPWVEWTVGGVWLAGSVCWLTLALVRMVRFQRGLRNAQPAPAEIRSLADDLAHRLGVRCPSIVIAPGAIAPLLWVFGPRPSLVLPAALLALLNSEQWRTLLAHELAHWKRRDHWVRWLELVALTAYWWCPLAWWAKRNLQQAEEECCDAWVVATLPEAARAYALALVEAVDFLSGARAVLPPAASGLGHVHLLKRRLTMILRGTTPRTLTLTGLALVVALGAVLLTIMPTWAQDQPPADEPAVQAPAAQPPAGQPAAGQPEPLRKKADEFKADDKKTPRDDPDDLNKLRDELVKAQQEINKIQQQMAEKRRDFEAKLAREYEEAMQGKQKRMMELMQRMGRGFGAPGAFNGPGGFPVPNAPPGAFPGAPGGLQPPGFAPPGGFPGGGGFGPNANFAGRPDLERRIDDIERKLDTLLRELRGGKTPPPPVAPAPPPPPKKDEARLPAAPRAPAAELPPPVALPAAARP